MSKTVLDAIDADLATLERAVPAPSSDLGYGVDLSCVSDITEDLAEVDPFSRQAIAEAVISRLTTARGSLPDDPDYGIDLRSYCNRGVTAAELRNLSGSCRSEILKDDRVEDATVGVIVAGPALSVGVRLTPANPAVEPFSLTFVVTSGSATLEAIA